MTKKLIKKIYHLNSLYSNRGLPTLNEQSRLKVVIPEQEYPNPFQSLGVIKANRHLYDEISKDFLYRQSDLFNQKIIDIQKYKSKFGSIKIQQTQVSASNNKYDIPVIDLTEKKDKQSFGINHILPQNGILKLFTYYKYPNKNFPEGREQFSLFSKGNEIIISGGITINMKTLTIWSLNLEKLEWKKININGYSYNRYGHTGIYYQNKIYFFGGKIKYQKNSMTCGLEVFNFQDGQFTAPSAGKLIPEPRRNHTAELLGNQIFIFGGITNTNEVLNDCFLLNINPLKWYTCIINKYTPGPHLYGHTSCVVIPTYILKNHKFSIYSYPNIEPGKANSLIKEKGIYVFGGKSKEEGGISNQLWILVTGKKPLEWIQPNTKGKPPSPIYSHSMSFYERGNFLIIHGGRNDSISDNIALNDTYLFDLENFEWLKVELYSGMKDFKVLNRCGHQSMIYLDKLIIVGGMNNNNYLGSSLMIINMDFSYMNLTGCGAHVGNFLNSNKSLEKLILINVQLNAADFKNIFWSIKTNNIIKEIDVSLNDMGGDKSLQYIADGIKENKSLNCLKMDKININNDNYQIIFDAIEQNKKITHYTVNYNSKIKPKIMLNFFMKVMFIT